MLAHVRMIGISAMSMKCPDWFGAHACSGCHDYVDGRTPSTDSFEKRRLAHLEGMVRTQYKLMRAGVGPDLLSEAEISHD